MQFIQKKKKTPEQLTMGSIHSVIILTIIERAILDLCLEFIKWCAGKLSDEKMMSQLASDIASMPKILFTCFRFYSD